MNVVFDRYIISIYDCRKINAERNEMSNESIFLYQRAYQLPRVYTSLSHQLLPSFSDAFLQHSTSFLRSEQLTNWQPLFGKFHLS